VSGIGCAIFLFFAVIGAIYSLLRPQHASSVGEDELPEEMYIYDDEWFDGDELS
jgi:hypothetical protein